MRRKRDYMSEEFTPITIESQEQFDALVKDRLSRQNEKHSKELAEKLGEAKSGFESQLTEIQTKLDEAEKKISGYDSIISEKDKEIKKYELASVKSQIARETGLSFDAVDFLQGEDEESIRKSAEALKNLVKVAPAPMATNEPRGQKTESGAYREMLKNL